ncbi:MFS transporter [Sphingomonadaceae bacterium OTU29LAMAA1]|nr:MFS transporter [Sphingomonadaceae bacterium OTU29LAMAA1]
MTAVLHIDTPAEARQRRMALFALFVVSAFNYFDRTILSVLQIPIKTELGLSDGQLGALTGFTFALFYATLSLPIARLADRYNRRIIVAISLAIWSAMTALCGFATGFASLAFFRIGVAIGEAGSVPASVSLIADYYPPHRRAMAVSVWGLALPAGLLIGYGSIGALANAVGWRLAFAIVGGIGVLIAPLVLAMVGNPIRGRLDGAGAKAAAVPPLPLGQALALLWRTPAYRWVAIAGMFHGFSQYAMMTWNAPFFVRTHHLSLRDVSFLMALLSGVAGAIGMYGSGWLTDRLAIHDRRWRVWIMGASVAATVPCALVQYLASSTNVSIVAAGFSSMLMIAYYGPIVAATQSAVPPTMRAFGNAMLLLTFNLFGLGLGPLAAGALSDWLNPTFGDDALRYALVLVLAPSVLAAGLFFYAGRYWQNETVADKEPLHA